MEDVKRNIMIGTIVITKELMASVFKTILSYAGTAISVYSSIFGDKVSNLDTSKLYEDISKLVKDENKRQSIAEKLAVISSATYYYTIDYANQKGNVEYTTEKAEADLKNNLHTLSQAIEFLKGDYVKKNAINEFILGAGIALIYYKELAVIHNKGNIKDRPEYKTYKTYLTNYYNHAKTTADDLLKTRLEYITEIKRETGVIGEDPYVFYSFKDKFTNKNYSSDAVIYGEKKAKEMAENERRKLVDSLNDDMKNIYDVLEQWDELIKNEDLNYRKSESYGDMTTNYFDDISEAKRIKKITVNYGCIIDGITITYNDNTSIHHGGVGGQPVNVLLEDNDFISEINGYFEKWKNHSEKALSLITFKTNKGKTYGPYGRRPYSNHEYQPIKEENLFEIKRDNDKEEIIAFFGNNSYDNGFISKIGVYFKKL